jgi:hypothetical protein
LKKQRQIDRQATHIENHFQPRLYKPGQAQVVLDFDATKEEVGTFAVVVVVEHVVAHEQIKTIYVGEGGCLWVDIQKL